MQKKFTYPVSPRALKKWNEDRLEHVSSGDDHRWYRFRYSGSTCNNGGIPFEADMHVRLSGKGENAVIEKARIEFPEETKGNAAYMCAAGGKRAEADSFFNKLAQDHDITGRTVEDVITEDVQVNHAGCFCAPSMVRDKWNQVLSTIHWRETNELGETETAG